MGLVMQSTPTKTNIMVTMLKDKEQGKANISTKMEKGMKEPSLTIKNMELENLSQKIKENTMVLSILFRTMGKWGQTWRRNIYIC